MIDKPTLHQALAKSFDDRCNTPLGQLRSEDLGPTETLEQGDARAKALRIGRIEFKSAGATRKR